MQKTRVLRNALRAIVILAEFASKQNCLEIIRIAEEALTKTE